MRTSTVLVLVLFLCFATSSERRGGLREIVHDARDFVHELTAPRGERSSRSNGYKTSREDTAETREIKAKLADSNARAEAASRAQRAVDRSIRQLDDRMKELARESRCRTHRHVYQGSVELLDRQVDELKAERSKLADLQTQLRDEKAQLQAALDLAYVRVEREAVESLLGRKPTSPLDALAFEER